MIGDSARTRWNQFGRRVWRAIVRGMQMLGASTAGVVLDPVEDDGSAGRASAKDPQVAPARMRGPAAAHPERLRPDVPPSPEERRLWRGLQ